jgi:hypothetical protein
VTAPWSAASLLSSVALAKGDLSFEALAEEDARPMRPAPPTVASLLGSVRSLDPGESFELIVF